MIRITLNGKKYKGIYLWKEMTLDKFCELAAIPMPEGYESFIIADGKFTSDNLTEYLEAVSKITDNQLNNDFPDYYRKVISCLSDVPVDKLTTDQVNDLYEWYFKPFVISLIYGTPVIHFMGQVKQYEPQEIKRFIAGREIFYVPETVTIMDQEIPLRHESLIAYCDACDILHGMRIGKDDVKRLALFMGIYCRKKGEKYDEQRALERQQVMMKVPMSIVWSVFFYTVRRLPDYTMITLLFGRLPKQIREIVEKARTLRGLGVGV